jgi:hypothetical protein
MDVKLNGVLVADKTVAEKVEDYKPGQNVLYSEFPIE